jgi:hypothetical protein
MTKTHIFLYKDPKVLHWLKDTDNPHGDQNFLYSFPMLVLTSNDLQQSSTNQQDVNWKE